MPGRKRPPSISLHGMPAEAAVQSVLARTADFCITSLPAEQPGLEAHGFFQNPLAWWPSHPTIRWRRARPSPSPISPAATVATMANPFRLRRRVDRAFATANVQPGRLIATGAAINAVKIASTELGVAIIEPATGYGLGLANVEIRPLDVDIPFLWAIFSAQGRPLSASAHELDRDDHPDRLGPHAGLHRARSAPTSTAWPT
ncbi:MAG: LysR substrate-binding domain-containing protein [Micropruina sp.]|uniref:LysR substrate-binding domain-containing protein n=1 Tax=Micropruina sp. TaxID=2737536 RepID=UPI0039E3CE6C